MTTNMFRICSTILAFGLAASQATLQAQDNGVLKGVWHVSVTVTNCQTGALIRNVTSLQEFRSDGSIIETAFTASRGISEGVYHPAGGGMYDETFWFFRYKPDGTFASLAKGSGTIRLGPENGKFTAVETVQDFDANGVLISSGCVTHSAVRLSRPE
jgi:hypothetical protein